MNGAPGEFVSDVRRLVEERRARLVGLCGDLVACDSAQPRGRTVEAAAVVADFLREADLLPVLRWVDPEKPNVVCTFGTGGPHLVLNGHLDTLPPGNASDWSVPILEMTHRDGKLYGLGLGNMKAGTAALALAFTILARLERSPGRITFTAVADEVVFGPAGAEWLLADDHGLRGDALINAEGPGAMGLAVAEKGLLWVEITATAEPGQGMLATAGSGAVIRLAAVLEAIDGWNEEHFAPPDDIAAVADDAGAHGLRLSVNVGEISGGSFISQIATSVRAAVDFRMPPGVTVTEIERRLDAATAAQSGVAWRRIKGWDPSWSGLDTPVAAAVAEAARCVRGEARPVVRLPASDAARWRALGVDAVSFGPQAGLASGVDDFVHEEHLIDCATIYTLAALAYLRRAWLGGTP